MSCMGRVSLKFPSPVFCEKRYKLSRRSFEDRRQRSEDRGQKSEDRGQKSECRRQKTECRRQKSEGRNQNKELRIPKFHAVKIRPLWLAIHPRDVLAGISAPATERTQPRFSVLPAAKLKRETCMTRQKKITAAISSAVYTYLAMEQSAAEELTASREATEARVAFQASSPWALAGRQAIMERSAMLQLRMNR